MGSYSVYCSISNISITRGNKCVFVALKKRKKTNEYLPYLPATLPIFGEYDDYGNLENIEEDENTKLIEEHFNCSIEDFCRYFTRGIITTHDSDFPKQLNDFEEMEGWKFMFIDRKVYDFMSTYINDGYDGKGYLDFGKKSILELIGFKYNGEKTCDKLHNPSRYKYEWELNNEKFYSDGSYLMHSSGKSVFLFDSLSSYVKIPEDKKWIGEKSMWQLWDYLNEEDAKKELVHIIDINSNSLSNQFKILAEIRGKSYIEPEPKTLSEKYDRQYKVFGKLLCDLVTIRNNLYPMSGTFSPYVPYNTPQCGEYSHHQRILEKFSDINKSYIDDEE